MRLMTAVNLPQRITSSGRVMPSFSSCGCGSIGWAGASPQVNVKRTLRTLNRNRPQWTIQQARCTFCYQVALFQPLRPLSACWVSLWTAFGVFGGVQTDALPRTLTHRVPDQVALCSVMSENQQRFDFPGTLQTIDNNRRLSANIGVVRLFIIVFYD